ncbi:MAG: alpha-hydroxy acid oxidase [Planctomycetaceae bacterium]
MTAPCELLVVEYEYNPNYPTIDDLRARARKRVPRFAFEYLDGGCNDDVNMHRNTADIRDVQLEPYYLRDHSGIDLKAELFGHVYDAPFGIAPMGLQGLIWPRAVEILARASVEHNIPFVLSTAATGSIEDVAEITQGRAWFQLYHPAEDSLRDKLITRAERAGCPVLVVVCDVPTVGFRPRDIRNGLAMPPKMTLRNMLQIATKPGWAIRTLLTGRPNFEVVKPYMPKNLNLANLGEFMKHSFVGRVNAERIAPIRDMWKGKLVLKGIASEEDAEAAIRLGVDGIIVSNHGGRQLDAAESSIVSLTRIAKNYGDRLVVMMDSGIRSGPDIARTLACGARFTFLGRPFMYGVAALGNSGGDHTIAILKAQLLQLMEQICCTRIQDFPSHLIRDAAAP